MDFYSSFNKIRPMVNIYILSYNINYIQSIVIIIMNFMFFSCGVINIVSSKHMSDRGKSIFKNWKLGILNELPRCYVVMFFFFFLWSR